MAALRQMPRRAAAGRVHRPKAWARSARSAPVRDRDRADRTALRRTRAAARTRLAPRAATGPRSTPVDVANAYDAATLTDRWIRPPGAPALRIGRTTRRGAGRERSRLARPAHAHPGPAAPRARTRARRRSSSSGLCSCCPTAACRTTSRARPCDEPSPLARRRLTWAEPCPQWVAASRGAGTVRSVQPVSPGPGAEGLARSPEARDSRRGGVVVKPIVSGGRVLRAVVRHRRGGRPGRLGHRRRRQGRPRRRRRIPAVAATRCGTARASALFGARNEIVAFQVIVEADGNGIRALSAALPELRLGSDAIAYRAPAADPTRLPSIGPIQLFVGQLHARDDAVARELGVGARLAGRAARIRLGWKPVQLVPENARAGRGGFPVPWCRAQNQAIWIEIYTGRDRPAGIYQRHVRRDGRWPTARSCPSRSSSSTSRCPTRTACTRWCSTRATSPSCTTGATWMPAYHRFAHRHRIELVHAYDERDRRRPRSGRFTGADFTRDARLRRARARAWATSSCPRSFYGPGTGFDDRAQRVGACRRVDDVSARSAAEGADVPLHAGRAAAAASIPRILQLADNVHSNPGPGRALPIFVTHAVRGGARRRDRHLVLGPAGLPDRSRARSERARGHDYWFYNGGRPAGGAITIDAPATDARATDLGRASSTTSRVYFYWHGVHWRHNSQKQGERNQNVWADSITFDNRGQPNKPIDDQGYINGDGVLLYPGRRRAAPRRGPRDSGPDLDGAARQPPARAAGSSVPDARPAAGTDGGGGRSRCARSCRACSRTPATTVSFPETRRPVRSGAPEAGARDCGRSRTGHAGVETSGEPVLFDTPEADASSPRCRSSRPTTPGTRTSRAARAPGLGARSSRPSARTKPLGFNLDMNFVIVPPDQPRVPVRITQYPDEVGSGAVPIPDNAPIENWPLARNEDAGRCRSRADARGPAARTAPGTGT